jgi:small neutral amino acid transporter SnatA (MarC family)
VCFALWPIAFFTSFFVTDSGITPFAIAVMFIMWALPVIAGCGLIGAVAWFESDHNYLYWMAVCPVVIALTIVHLRFKAREGRVKGSS